MAAHRIPYVATATLGYPQDLVRKVLKAKSLRGMRFLNLLAPCCTGWRFPPNLGVKLSRMAVQSRVFQLVEVEEGIRWQVQKPKQETPVRDFLAAQGRFSHFTRADFEDFEKQVEEEWKFLLARASGVTEV